MRRPAEPRTGPLSDEEFARLDDWLSALPDERDGLDVPMLDGFLTGVLLCREVVLPSRWLPVVLGAGDDAPPLPGDVAETQEILDLIMRHYNALAAHIAAREPFEPYVLEVERDDGDELAGDQRFAGLWPWAMGFARAIDEFQLMDDDSADEAIGGLLVHILRHLPSDPDDRSDAALEWEIEMREVAERYPLDDLDQAIEEVVASVMDIADITRPRRPISREGVKTGRNDPCPCGSGRKYKHCHGGSTH